MFYIILCFIWFLAVIVITSINTQGDDWDDKILLGLMNFLIGMIATAIISGITFLIVDTTTKTHYEKYSEDKIVALNDNSSISGSFYLGSGNFNGSMMYVYMTKRGEEYNMGNVSANRTSIIYSNDTKIEQYNNVRNSKAIEYWFGACGTNPTYKIYVPEGTIKQNYNVDLK